MSEKTLTAEQVRSFLKENTSFFIDHSDILASLNLPQTIDGNIASFSDFQTRKLKQKITKLEERIQLLMRTAVQNEKSTHQLNLLVSDILCCETKQDIYHMLSERLKREFDLDGVSFTAAMDVDIWPEAEVMLQKADDSRCLHESNGICMRSEALLTLHYNGEKYGVLALESTDETRFHEGQGNELLSFFRHIVSHQLWTCAQQQQTKVS